MLETGTYYPNIPGARTLADARPLYAGTERVSIVIDEATATLFFGGRIVATRARGDFASHADLAGWASGLAAEETVDGFAVETVNVMDLKEGDQVVHEGRETSWFVSVTTAPFRPESYNGRTGETIVSKYPTLTLGGTRKTVGLETVYKRAKNPQAVKKAAWDRQRALTRSLRDIHREVPA